MRGGVIQMNISEWIAFARENWKKEEGQTMAEYGVALALITVASVAVFPALGNAVLSVVNQVTGLLP
jgi:Flp pilus assembly pilin Flp